MKPVFLITIDTEGDNLWSRDRMVTTRNANYLPRFQALCEKFKFKPTYLTNYEMAVDKNFCRFARGVVDRGVGEIGMHLHAWNSPPEILLTNKDYINKPYLVDYEESIIRSKVEFMTNLLEDMLSKKIVSHRAGRWAFDNRYAKILLDYGYKIDCSVTPGVSWKSTKGHPDGDGGTNYEKFPNFAYFMDAQDISKVATSGLLEIPMTIMKVKQPFYAQILGGLPIARRLVSKKWPSPVWLRPNMFNLKAMILLVEKALEEKRPYIEFMLHSSEFMPGGSPNFPDNYSIEKLYADLEVLFSYVEVKFQGNTLEEFGSKNFNIC